jgi:hypothetical protein
VDRRLLLATLALPLLPACASRTKFDQAPFNPIPLGPHEGLDNWPAVGAESMVEVGAVVAKTFNFVKLPALEVTSAYRKTSPYRGDMDMELEVRPGKLELVATDGRGGKYYRGVPGVNLYLIEKGRPREPDTRPGGVHVTEAGATSVYWLWSGRDNANFIPAPDFVVKPTTASRPLERTGFQRELVYTGLSSGSTISLQYRELLDNMNRPILTQELKYDIGRSRTIGFKDARIEVVDAGNTSIRYRVLTPLK